MEQECPICLESAPNLSNEESLFQCRHTTCRKCAVNLLRHQCMGSCPICRADPKPSNQFNIQIVSGERQIFCTDNGHYRILDDDDLRVGEVQCITELVGELTGPVVVGVRYVESSVAYLVHGPPSCSLLDILSEVPRSSLDGRAGRHARIELGREMDLFAELINGYALPAVEFVRHITFPVRLIEVELETDENDVDQAQDVEVADGEQDDQVEEDDDLEDDFMDHDNLDEYYPHIDI